MATDWEWPEARDFIQEPLDDFDPPSLFARALAETIPTAPTLRLLDVGCGLGIIGLYCLAESKVHSVTFSDLNPNALYHARKNASWLADRGLLHTSRVGFTAPIDLTDIPVETATQHDLITFNPPQLPTDRVDPGELQRIEANADQRAFRIGGPDGLNLARAFLSWYASTPRPRPKALMTLSSIHGWRTLMAALGDVGLVADIAGERRIPLRPLLVSFADSLKGKPDELAERSLRRERENGEWTKKLFVLSIR